MELLIDVGNTAIKWVFVKSGQLTTMQKLFYSATSLSEELQQLEVAINPVNIQSVFISNVAGEKVRHNLNHWCLQTLKLRPSFATVSAQFNGLVNAYNPLDNLGIDRWMALIAAFETYQSPICVVDIGTAITIDAIDEKNTYIGGVILPGIALMQQSLQQNTDAIRPVSVDNSIFDFACNTAQGVQAGIHLAISSSVEKMVKNIEIRTDQPVLCVVTGGGAEQMKARLPSSVIYVPDLVLKGIYLWGMENALDG